jgi:hypothetical protein
LTENRRAAILPGGLPFFFEVAPVFLGCQLNKGNGSFTGTGYWTVELTRLPFGLRVTHFDDLLQVAVTIQTKKKG